MIWTVDRIRTWKDGYYNKDGSGVDDATYDLWWSNLLHLEAKYPHLVVKDSPTGAVGAPLPAGFITNAQLAEIYDADAAADIVLSVGPPMTIEELRSRMRRPLTLQQIAARMSKNKN